MGRLLQFALVAFFLMLAVVASAQVVPQQATPTGSGVPWWSFLIPIVGPIVSGLIAFGGVWLGLRNAEGNTRRALETAQRNSDASIWQKANETELREIQAKLDEFYVPFQLLSKANHQIAQDVRARQPEGYRMLLKLFDKNWRDSLSDGDKKLVEIVCGNGEELRALIASKSGLVDDKILPYLSRASAHFRILHLAYNGELGTDPERFRDYVYPRELDGVLALEIARLRSRIEELRANPAQPPAPLAPLVIPTELQLTNWVDPDGRL
jgi:hypothetical protein